MADGTLKIDSGIILRTIPQGKVKNDKPHYGLKEHASASPGGILSKLLIRMIKIYKKVYAARYFICIIPLGEREPNRMFLHLNKIADGLRLVEPTPRRA